MPALRSRSRPRRWARGRACVPQWAALLAIALEELTPERLLITLKGAEFSWQEMLGVAPNADVLATRQAMMQLALRYHPDNGGSAEPDDP